MKEIHEQPHAVHDTLYAYLTDESSQNAENAGTDEPKLAIDLEKIGIPEEVLKNLSQIYIVACGSASYVGNTAQYIYEDMAQIPTRVDIASEFRYRHAPLDKNGLVIVISQSGETADTLEAVRMAKSRGVKTLAIVNVTGSSIAREADYVVYTYAGPEIAVATTKAFSCQLIVNYLLAISIAKAKGLLSEDDAADMLIDLNSIPEKIKAILEDKERLQWFASKFSNVKDAFFIGRGIDYAICMEGSLKMKEVSYVHSEAYAAGELKHGTISLIEQNTLAIGVLTQSDIYAKTISNMQEVKSRGGYLMGVTTKGNYDIEETTDFTVFVPKINEYFSASLAVIPLQVLGYYLAIGKGLDPDKPRNLAKSVTVE
ncbi:MAG: isomerizing glutamine--fructose-6-phosphate transaminase, partial [Lachnospiraceae bacterium]|nr:isomerizing glutamine--fructose-6-phosphate transaminase [Candidatus Equihabitans merdae]